MLRGGRANHIRQPFFPGLWGLACSTSWSNLSSPQQLAKHTLQHTGEDHNVVHRSNVFQIQDLQQMTPGASFMSRCLTNHELLDIILHHHTLSLPTGLTRGAGGVHRALSHVPSVCSSKPPSKVRFGRIGILPLGCNNFPVSWGPSQCSLTQHSCHIRVTVFNCPKITGPTYPSLWTHPCAIRSKSKVISGGLILLPS